MAIEERKSIEFLTPSFWQGIVTIEFHGRKDKLHKWNACLSDDNYIRNVFLLTNDTTQTV